MNVKLKCIPYPRIKQNVPKALAIFYALLGEIPVFMKDKKGGKVTADAPLFPPVDAMISYLSIISR